MNRTSWVWVLVAVCVGVAALHGCAKGGNEGQFVQACMTGPGQHNTEALCKCAAHQANTTLSGPQFQAMVLDMQGKAPEAERLLGDMNFDQRAAFGMKQFEILGKCVEQVGPH